MYNCTKSAQQSVHPRWGFWRDFQAFFYALAFSQSDGGSAARPSAGNAIRWAA